MKKHIALLLTFMIVYPSAGQQKHENIIPLSPNATSFAIYADYPVSHYTGIPKIDLPLYVIDVDDLKIPISLNYHSSGIRVSQEASWVGLGWTLNVGGAISRTIKFWDDFVEYPHSSVYGKGYYNSPDIAYSNCSSLGMFVGGDDEIFRFRFKVDVEPDIFYYSLPNSSGKFILDKSRGAVLFNSSHDIKIEIIVNGIYHNFKITDGDGTQYFYEERELTDVYSGLGSLNDNLELPNSRYDDSVNEDYELPKTYASSWFMSKIITKNKSEIIFYYDQETYSSPTNENKTKYNLINIQGQSPEPLCVKPAIDCSRSKTYHQNVRLSKISWNNGYIVFSCSGREDIIQIPSSGKPPKKLDVMSIYDRSNKCLKKIAFDYSYFNDDYSGEYQHIFKRLRLDKVYEMDTESHVLNSGYKFTYHEGSMPAKNSKNTDYWGYNNGKKYGSNYQCAIYHENIIYGGAIKMPDSNYIKIGTLNRIEYPTGESTDFFHESNSFSNPFYEIPEKHNTSCTVFNKYELEDYYTPGLLSYDKDTIHIPVAGNIKISAYMENYPCHKDDDFLYEDTSMPIAKLTRISPNIQEIKIYTMPHLYGDQCDAPFDTPSFTVEPGIYVFEALTPPKDVLISWRIEADIVNNMLGMKKGGGLRISKIKTGNMIRHFNYYNSGLLTIKPYLAHSFGYITLYCQTKYVSQFSESSVPISTLRNGNSVGYSYVSESIINENDTSMTLYYFFNSIEEPVSDECPYVPTDINYSNGFPIEVKYYTNDFLVKHSKYQYVSKYYSNPVIGYITAPDYMSKCIKYTYFIEWLLKEQEETISYYQDPIASVVEEKFFAYNGANQLISEKLLLDGNVYENHVYYPTDLDGGVYESMKNKNMINYPIEILKTKNNKVIFSNKTSYMDTIDMILPKMVSNLCTTVPLSKDTYENYFETGIQYNVYNPNGKIIQLKLKENVFTYLYNNSQYPVAEIKNATYAEVVNVLNPSFISYLNNNNPSDSEIQSMGNNLRNGLTNAQVTTYTYKPLVGMTSQTDPRGVTTYYEYDDFGRLKATYIGEKDANGNETRRLVTGTYRYHYKE